MRRSFPSVCRAWLVPVLAGFLAGSLGVSTAAAQDQAERPLQFVNEGTLEPVREVEGPVRTGHVTLAWVPDPQAAGYRVTDSSGRERYEGRMAEAFLSGLRDGVYHFRVASVDQNGEVIRGGPEPVTVTVQHYPLGLTWALFSVGAVVMLVLVGVLVTGARAHRKRENRKAAAA